MNKTAIVRQFAAANTTVRKKQVKESLDLTIDQVSYAFDTLVRQGYLKRIGHGSYLFSDYVQKIGPDINDKIWKAMRVSSGAFSSAEIARLASSSTSYVYKRMRLYTADGYVKPAGVRRTHGTGQEHLYRLTPKGKERSLNPNVEKFTPDPLVMAAVNLNRLICSGLAVRDPAAATQALAFVDQIKKGLEDAGTSAQAENKQY